MRLPALLLVSALLLPACSATGDSEDAAAQPEQTTRSADGAAELRQPSGEAAVADGRGGAELAVSTSAALYESAPVVLLAGTDDLPAQARAASVAVSLGTPLLLSPAGAAGSGPVAAELERLSTQAVLTMGDAAGAWAQDLDVDVVSAPADDEELAELTGAQLGPQQAAAPADVVAATAALAPGGAVPVLAVEPPAAPDESGPPTGADAPTEPADRDEDAELPRTSPPAPVEGTVVLSTPDPGSLAAVATARAAGTEVLVVAEPDPRADAAVVEQLAERGPAHVLGLGAAFGEDARFASRVATASTGVQLPGGGQLILAGKRYVALYGHPGSSALGVLGEQGPDASVARAARLAAEYDAVSDDAHTVPTFEVIATVASSAAGADGDYSSESTIEHLRPHVDAAARSGTYVVLDLQPGYTDFLTQARLYEELLVQPHVGLALDPEWRLAPGQRHMQQIGRVSADEVNAVGDWLAELVRERQLPQKMLLLHQFKTFMLEERERIVADRDELAVVTQMDGHGPVSTKLDTWNVLLQDPPAGMTFGWKNFYDEDPQTMTPAQTLAVRPTPVFISYQ